MATWLSEIKPHDWITIVAIVLGPLIALWIQRGSERRQERRLRQRNLFKELMATRASKVGPRHVDALNAIEIDFAGRRRHERTVVKAWKIYFQHLCIHTDPANTEATTAWAASSNDLLTKLLFAMSQALRLGFDEPTLRDSIYYPTAQSQLESEQQMVRRFLLEMMEGKRVIWTGLVTGERPVQMEIVNLHLPATSPVGSTTVAKPAAGA